MDENRKSVAYSLGKQTFSFDHPAAPAAAYMSQLNVTSMSTIKGDFKRMAQALGASSWEEVDWGDLTPEKIQEMWSRLPGSPSALHRAKSVLRNVIRVAFHMGRISAERCRELLATPLEMHQSTWQQRIVRPQDLQALIRACMQENTPTGLRDAALIATGVASGAQLDSICRVTVDQARLYPDRAEVTAVGKDGNPVTWVLKGIAAEALSRWLNVRTNHPGYLFCRFVRYGRPLYDYPLSLSAVKIILARRVQAADIQPFSWRDVARFHSVNGGDLDVEAPPQAAPEEPVVASSAITP